MLAMMTQCHLLVLLVLNGRLTFTHLELKSILLSYNGQLPFEI